MSEGNYYYHTKVEPRCGDRLLLAGSNHLVVESVHVTIETLVNLGLDEATEFGVLTVGDNFGHMFVSLIDQELEFIARTEDGGASSEGGSDG